jgi:hypothetical protein
MKLMKVDLLCILEKNIYSAITLSVPHMLSKVKLTDSIIFNHMLLILFSVSFKCFSCP